MDMNYRSWILRKMDQDRHCRAGDHHTGGLFDLDITTSPVTADQQVQKAWSTVESMMQRREADRSGKPGQSGKRLHAA